MYHEPIFIDLVGYAALWSLTLFTVASLFVVGGDAPLDFEVGGRLAVVLTVWSRFGQRQVAAGG